MSDITGTDNGETLNGTSGSDTIRALGGNDIVTASAGTDTVDGGAGVDSLVASLAAIAFADGALSLTLTGSHLGDASGLLDTSFTSIELVNIQDATARAVSLDASAYPGSTINNVLVGVTAFLNGAGNRTVTGSAANDAIYVGSGVNLVDAGAGTDFVSMTLPNAGGMITASQSGTTLTLTKGGQVIDTIINAESYQFAAAATTAGLSLDASGVTTGLALAGTAGTDVIVGSQGGDTIQLAGGNDDRYTGGAGADLFFVTSFASLGTTTTITDFSADDLLNFGGPLNMNGYTPRFLGTAAFTGAAGQYRYDVSGGATRLQIDINGDGTADRTIILSNGPLVLADSSNVLSVAGTVATGTPLIAGTSAAETVTGTAANESIYGLGGDDTVVSGGGHDIIDGGAGADTVVLGSARAGFTALDVNGMLVLVGGGASVVLSNVETVQFSDQSVAAATLLSAAAAFDPLIYLASNPDLAIGFGANGAAAIDHFINHGLAEGRAYASFDPLQYLAVNPDLATGYGADTNAATLHYIQHGIAEGRMTYGFDALRYLASNPDLAAGYGTDTHAAILHWIQHGISEGRSTTAFDPLQYLAANADLAAAWHYDPVLAETHYIQHGMAEGRATSGFDAVAYLLSNADLAAAHLTVAQALQHWVTNGASEGRSGDALFGREQASHAEAVGTAFADTLQVGGDHDWFTVALAAGQHVSILMHAVGFAPTLTLADEHGVQLAIQALTSGTDTTIDFTADHAATYYLTAASTNGIAGNYLIDVEPA